MQQRKLRRKSRQTCLQVLYSNDLADVSTEDVLCGKASLPHIDQLDDYTIGLIKGTVSNMDEIDKMINDVAENWTLDRMSVSDRCLLRQSVYEMLYVDEVPISVSINEAVELAKQFGGDDESHKFVNGILGKIAKQIEKD